MKKYFSRVARSILNLSAGESGWINLNENSSIPTRGFSSASGPTVSATTAMTLSAVWACITKNSQTAASLPLQFYKKTSDGGREPYSDQMTEILSQSPNSYQTANEYWESEFAQLWLNGNGYSEKKFIGNRMIALEPIFGITPEKIGRGKFQYSFDDRGKREILPDEKVFHLRGFTSGDGLGLSPIKYGANSMGAALAADESSGKFYKNGMNISGFLQSSQVLTPEQRVQIQEMMESFTGSEAAHKLMVLEAGLEFKEMQMNPEDAQLLLTRRFSVEDVCRWFGTPPIVIGHSQEGQTMWGSGVEHIMLAWLQTGINPFLKKVEQRISKNLISAGMRNNVYAEFNREAMLQMDSDAKGTFLSKMTANGIMDRNEARQKLNLDKREGAGELTVQSAMINLDNLVELSNGGQKNG